MTGRKLRKDELELWKQIAERVTPISKREPIEFVQTSEPQPKAPEKMNFAPTLPSTLPGGKTSLKNNLRPTLQQSLSQQLVSMDKKAFKRMQGGKLKPDARVDLHGMTMDRAHSVLTRFVMSSHASGKRLLLVITGKGKHRDDGGPIPVRFGVLRHQVPEWLKLAPLSSVVLQVTQAHISHGGGGAYYVYLRRSR